MRTRSQKESRLLASVTRRLWQYVQKSLHEQSSQYVSIIYYLICCSLSSSFSFVTRGTCAFTVPLQSTDDMPWFYSDMHCNHHARSQIKKNKTKTSSQHKFYCSDIWHTCQTRASRCMQKHNINAYVKEILQAVSENVILRRTVW